MSEPETPRRLTPTERAHEIMLAALRRPPIKASQGIKIARTTKGDWAFDVDGVAGEAETLEELAPRVLSIARDLHEELPLSRRQEAERQYTAQELGKK
jgi:hypothetical protein